MMGFGFVVARFALFLREVSFVRLDVRELKPGVSLWFGTFLVLAGVVLNVMSVLEYRRLVHRLNEQNQAHWPVSRLATWTATLLAVFGVVIAVYLVALL